MRCKYILKTVKIDNSYKHGYYFQNDETRRATIIGSSAWSSEEINFDFGRILTTQCIVNEYNNENYMIINNNGDIYYYFVISAIYKAVNQWQLTLELDVITQYITGLTREHVSECLIKRAHCNRFTNSENGIKFNVSEDSPIVQRESSFDTFLQDRKVVDIVYNSTNSTVNKWFNENVLCWCYMFVDKNFAFNIDGVDSTTEIPTIYQLAKKVDSSKYQVGNSELSEEYGVMAFPIYKSDKRISLFDPANKVYTKIENDEEFRLSDDGIYMQYVYNIKFSKIPPANFIKQSGITSVDSNGNLRITLIRTPSPTDEHKSQEWEFSQSGLCVRSFRGNHESYEYVYIEGVLCITLYGSLFCNVNHHEVLIDEIDVSNTFNFTVSELKSLRHKRFEPKLLLDCQKIVLRDSSNGEYVYNPLWLDSNKLTPEYSEMLNITNTNYYYRLKSSGLYNSAQNKNWDGVCNTIDLSQQIVNDNYAQFIANNKNFLLGKALDLVPAGIIAAVSQNYSGVASVGLSALSSYLNVDNINNKPNSLRNVGNTAELLLNVNNGINLYVDIEKAREVEIDRYYEKLFRYGYEINKIGNIFDFINTRHYFNFIQCELEYIGITGNDAIDDKIRMIFSNGITLWNDYVNIYNYSMENYEKWLDN